MTSGQVMIRQAVSRQVVVVSESAGDGTSSGAGVPLLNIERPLLTPKPWYANRHTWQAAGVALTVQLLRAT